MSISEDGLARPQTNSQAAESIDVATLHRSKRKMEEKAPLYASMKPGNYVAPTDGRADKEEKALVDSDRKWAEQQESGKGNDDDTSSDDYASGSASEMVEYEDEVGRLRRGIKTEAAHELRRRNVQAHASATLSEFSARPEKEGRLAAGRTVVL